MTESRPEAESGSQSPDEEAFDVRLVRDLADVLNDTGLTEIEVERGDLRIRVAKTVAAAAVPSAIPATVVAAPAAAELVSPPVASPARAAGDAVKSPMVGTVYLQSQPGAPPFVRIGDRVNQ
jgi:acetyl-CoA carboxylase biotin carboxyl carrier protein